MPRLHKISYKIRERNWTWPLYFKKYYRVHGGKIWAENNPNGEGATFSFSLPTINSSRFEELDSLIIIKKNMSTLLCSSLM
jgi:hypothetical protein